MSDPTNPIAPVAQEPVAAPPAAAAPSAPAPAAAAPAAPETPAKPPYVNPWQGRAPAPVAPVAKAAPPAPPAAAPGPVAPPAPPAAAPGPVAPAAPAADPRVDALLGVLGESVAQDRKALAPNVDALVTALAGDDVLAQRKVLNALRANGIAVSPGAVPAPLAPAATTINAPPVAVPEVRTQEGGDADLLTHYQKLKASGAHYAASNFLIKHSDAITRAQARQSTH